MVCLPEHPPSSLLPGDVLGQYVILRPLGRGAAGAVYEAHDPRLDRRVALKVLHGHGADEDALLHEARGLARVDHQNVVSIHELGEVDGRMFVAMELVRGQTLGQWLQHDRGWQQIVDVMLQAGAGLQAVHAAGLVHRDFKPSNVIIGDDGRVRVADFGLARACREQPVALAGASFEGEGIDTASDVAGTPAYMPPEAFDGLHRGVATDIWAFATVLCEALGGAHPFAAGHTAEYLAKIGEGRLRWGPRASSVPAAVRRAVGTWLHADRRRRPSSLAEVLDVLRAVTAPRRRLSAAGGLVAVVLAPWLAVSALPPSGADAAAPSTCNSTLD